MLGKPERRDHDHRVELGDESIDRIAADERARWVVIEDLVDDRCELAISPWPRLTDEGRLTFAGDRDEEAHQVGAIGATTFLELVSSARRRQLGSEADPALVTRPLRVGDTFVAWATVLEDEAARPRRRRDTVKFPRGGEGLADISAQARVLAQLQVSVAEHGAVDVRLLPDTRSAEIEP